MTWKAFVCTIEATQRAGIAPPHAEGDGLSGATSGRDMFAFISGPAGGRTASAADKDVVVHVPNGGLTSIPIAKDVIGLAVPIEITNRV